MSFEKTEIKTEYYSVSYEPATNTVICRGLLQLMNMQDYAPIIKLLEDAANQESSTLTLDLRGLEFLNSSGINVLLKFVIKVREKKNVQMVVQGSKDITWHSKSLKTLQRLMPTLRLELE